MRLSCPVVLVGNKIDLPWTVGKSDVMRWASERGCPIIFTSAKSGENVKELFQLVAEQIGKSRIEGRSSISPKIPQTARDEDCC
jgi:50S ribosomal subunit-associated GTPase HflX